MMGLNIETAPLYNADRTLSMIYFCEGTALVQDDPARPGGERLPPYEKTIPGNTILINTRAVHKDQCQLEIYHECILNDTTSLDAKISAVEDEIKEVVALNSAFIRGHSAKGADNEGFSEKTAEYDERYKKAQARQVRLQTERKERLARSRSIITFIEALLSRSLVMEQWDDQLWSLLVTKAVVSADGSIAFTFKGENTITVRME